MITENETCSRKENPERLPMIWPGMGFRQNRQIGMLPSLDTDLFLHCWGAWAMKTH